jgi:2-polyprenyl-3-methyl-5-hydroxy-6-metoxy-1,4-benzoquinol methylase
MALSEYHGLDRSSLVKLVDQTHWYHTIDLGNGVQTRGTFDLRPHLDKYGIPRDLTGKRVLDIGRASGFFSFEFERRGADVTATDVPTPWDKEFVGGG